MATVAGMAWEVAQRVFLEGYDSYQVRGPRCRCPFTRPGDKRNGLFVGGKDAARKRIPRDKAWTAFRQREEAVM